MSSRASFLFELDGSCPKIQDSKILVFAKNIPGGARENSHDSDSDDHGK
jgi:hypothetical protein